MLFFLNGGGGGGSKGSEMDVPARGAMPLASSCKPTTYIRNFAVPLLGMDVDFAPNPNRGQLPLYTAKASTPSSPTLHASWNIVCRAHFEYFMQGRKPVYAGPSITVSGGLCWAISYGPRQACPTSLLGA